MYYLNVSLGGHLMKGNISLSDVSGYCTRSDYVLSIMTNDNTSNFIIMVISIRLVLPLRIGLPVSLRIKWRSI